jgi:ribosomal protein S18 acetylase RimI-like enzyme
VTLRFETMTPQQERAYLPLVVEEYASELLRSGSYDEARARSRSERSYASLHEDGEIYLAAHDEAGTWVGVLGYVLKGFDDDPTTEPALFVYDLDVFEPFRRRGHATEILAHASAIAADAGASSVLLTVLEGNDGARALYEGGGFRYEAHQMRRPVETDRSS